MVFIGKGFLELEGRQWGRFSDFHALLTEDVLRIITWIGPEKAKLSARTGRKAPGLSS